MTPEIPQIEKIHLHVSIQNFGPSDESIGMACGKLNTKDIFGSVTFDEGPFGMLGFEKIRGNCHLSTGNVGAKVFHDAMKGQVANRCEGCNVYLAFEKHGLLYGSWTVVIVVVVVILGKRRRKDLACGFGYWFVVLKWICRQIYGN